LIRETRDLGGHIGNGGLAAGQGANAVGRIRGVGTGDMTDPKPFHLDRLFTRIDARISEIIEHGANQQLYFLRMGPRQLLKQPKHLRGPVGDGYVAMKAPIVTDLLDVVRTRLRPPPTPATPPTGAASSREQLHAAIRHRPSPTELSIKATERPWLRPD
jgi:hypothetical protein